MFATVINFKRVTLNDSAELLMLSRQTFFDAFAHLNSPADMEAYAAKAFQPEKITDEISNNDSHFYFAVYEGTTAGYIKLNFNKAQTDFRDTDAMEVERIYILNTYQGRQIGKQLLDFAVQIAGGRQLQYIWLGVWEHNKNAIRFYENNGFKIFSSHNFCLGDDLQTDVLMRKDIG